MSWGPRESIVNKVLELYAADTIYPWHYIWSLTSTRSGAKVRSQESIFITAEKSPKPNTKQTKNKKCLVVNCQKEKSINQFHWDHRDLKGLSACKRSGLDLQH